MSGLGNINGWSDEDYHAVMRAAEETFQATARLRAILPQGPKPNDRYYPTAPKLSRKDADAPWAIKVEAPEEPLHPKVDFEVEHKYLSDSKLLILIARRAAQALAADESRQLFGCLWRKSNTAETNPEVPVFVVDGKLGEQDEAKEMKRVLNKGLGTLQKNNHLGPHALVMTPEVHNRYRSLLFGSSSNRLFIGDALGGDLKDASVPTGKLPKDAAGNRAEITDGEGLLISLNGASVEFTEVDPPALSLVGYGADKMTFRLEARVAVRVFDTTSIVRISYK
ncbi:hypothetical protein L6R52_40450 [Myxococcota bacterium]|nr:hypothetical protein [Myxococcota bacterium]